MREYDRDTQRALFKEAMELFVSCGVPRHEIVSFRAGHFGANNETWQAMADVGLTISSNFNPCYLANGECQISWSAEHTGLFDTGLGVWELPISNLVEASGGYRHVQITALALVELVDYLEQAHALGYHEVTVVTHSFEFFHIDSVEKRLGRPNPINIARLRGLLRFLDKQRDRFAVETTLELARRLPDTEPRVRGLLPRGRPHLKLLRLGEQVVKRAEAQFPQWDRVRRRMPWVN
jgi:hypothetical protein